jgi:hypothetical protein
MDSVIVQYEHPITHRHAVYTLAPGRSLTFGRGAPNQPVDVTIEHPGVSRVAGRITASDDYWLLSNLSRTRTYVVEDPEGGGAHIKVTARRLGAPVPFELSKVRLPVDDGRAELVVFAPQHRFATRELIGTTDGETTMAPFGLDETAKYFLVLVALCEPRLRDGAAVTLPSDKEILARLRPLPGCSRISRSAVNFHLDYLARVKLRLRETATADGTRADWRRSALAAFALRFDLVNDDHLALLEPAPS